MGGYLLVAPSTLRTPHLTRAACFTLPSGTEWCELGGEVPQRRRLEGDLVPRQPVRLGGHRPADLDHVVDVALGVGPARNRQPDQVHAGRLLAAVGMPAEHHRADLARADAADLVQ